MPHRKLGSFCCPYAIVKFRKFTERYLIISANSESLQRDKSGRTGLKTGQAITFDSITALRHQS